MISANWRSGPFHINPLLGLRGLKNGIADILSAERMAEVWVAFLGRGVIERFEELRERVGERVFVAEAKAGNPLITRVGMIAIAAMDGAPAAAIAWDGVIKILKLI